MTLYEVTRADLEMGVPDAVVLHLSNHEDEQLMLRTPIDEAHLDRMHQILDGLDIGRGDFWFHGVVLDLAEGVTLRRGSLVPIISVGDTELVGRTLGWPPS